jgi:hypothetical protein
MTSRDDRSLSTPLTAYDRLDILDLYARAARAEDAGDAEEFVAAFTEEGVLEAPHGIFRGPDELRRYLVESASVRKGRRHLTANHVVTVEGDGARALADFVILEVDDAPRVLATGTYSDTIAREEGALRFSHRKVVPDPGMRKERRRMQGT